MISIIQKYLKSSFIYTYACIVVFVCIYVFFPETTFAQSWDSTWAEDLNSMYTTILSFISWAWVIPALLAGKLMSNDWVFGAVFKFDTVLWQLHVVVRTFVNFLVWFWFLKLIASALISSDIKWLAQDILRLIFAAILIQASWFIIAALVDLWTVTTAAIWSLPRIVFEETRKDNGTIIRVPDVVVKDGWVDVKSQDYTVGGMTNFDIETILPNADSISWPLLFLWVWLLNLPGATIIPDTSAELSQKVTTSLIKLIVIWMYVLPIFILWIVCVVRLFRLRIWIVMSPLIMFEWAMTMWGWKWVLWKELSDKTLHSSPWDVLWLIFMPTVVVACLSVWVIVATTMMFVIGNRWDYADAWNSNLWTILPGDGKIDWKAATSEVDWSLFKNVWYRSAGIMGELILTIFTIAMLRWLVKVWFSVSSVISGISDKLFSFAGKMISSTPIIPLGDYGSTSIASLTSGQWWAMNNIARFAGLDQGKWQQNDRDRSDQVLKDLGLRDENENYDIALDTSRSIVGKMRWSSLWTIDGLWRAVWELASDQKIKDSKQVTYANNTAAVFDAWLDSPDSSKWYGLLKALAPGELRNTSLEDFKKSKYMTRFLTYALMNPNAITDTWLKRALRDTRINKTPDKAPYDVKVTPPATGS